MGPGTKTSLSASYYIWEPPSRQVKVAVNLDLVEILKSFLSEAAQRGFEAGGILLGKRESGGGVTTAVTIERFEALDIKHVRGPAFSLTEKDKIRLRKRLVALSQQQPSLTVVGIVRSHNRRGLYLDPADFALFREFFQGPNSVFLVVRTGSSPTAGFFFWEEDDVRLHAPYKEFTFDRHALQAEPEETPVLLQQVKSKPAGVLPPSAPEAIQPHALAYSASRRTWKRLAWIEVAAVFLLAVIAWPHVRPSFHPRPVSSLGLNARSVDTLTVLLTWNARSPIIAGASHARLSIEDGPDSHTIDLSSQELLRGRKLYTPSSTEVRFVLEIAGKAGPNSESIHVVVPRPAITARTTIEEPNEAERKMPVEPDHSLRSPDRVAVPDVAARLHVTARPARIEQSVYHAVEKPRGVSKPKYKRKKFIAPMVHSSFPQLPQRVLDLVAVTPVRFEAPRAIPVIADLPRVSPPPPAFEANFVAAPKSKLRTVIATLSGAGKLEGKDFVPPKPVVEIEPDVPKPIAQSLDRELRLNFRMSVDKNGRVTDVELLSRDTDHRFVGLADIALRHWTFEPARVKDRAVSSELTMTVCFRNPFSGMMEAARR